MSLAFLQELAAMAVGHLFFHSSFRSVFLVNAATESCARMAIATLVLMFTFSNTRLILLPVVRLSLIILSTFVLFCRVVPTFPCFSICFYLPGCFGSLQSLRPGKDGAQGTTGCLLLLNIHDIYETNGLGR